MYKSKRTNKIYKTLIIFLLVILFPSGSYSIQRKDEIPTQLVVGGELLELDIETTKLMVYTNKGIKSKLKQYDLVESIQGTLVEEVFNKASLNNVRKEDILKLCLKMKTNDKLSIKILRNNKEVNLLLGKEEVHPSYFVNEIPFSASLTYINPKNSDFGAVAHSIDVNANEEILSTNGDMYLCNLSHLSKSSKKEVGNMYGDKVYNRQGEIKYIDEFGLKGILDRKDILKNAQVYDVGKKEEVSLGHAQVLIKENESTPKIAYDINIIKTSNQNKPEICSFEFRVVDSRLIEKYGGIVSGMSGCPIIQNGKIIGALSHVICNDTSRGTGVYIQWMLE
ncbi:MAG: SpoIVB peptidase S55 domain-containing protein [Romboutsia sp.]